MAYAVIRSQHLHMPSYFLGTFTEYPWIIDVKSIDSNRLRADFLSSRYCVRNIRLLVYQVVDSGNEYNDVRPTESYGLSESYAELHVYHAVILFFKAAVVDKSVFGLYLKILVQQIVESYFILCAAVSPYCRSAVKVIPYLGA